MRYFGIVQYKGTSYCGWQKQTVSKLPSIQEEIERVLSKILNQEIKIYGSGRTDAGVHAMGQTFHFDTEKVIDSYKFCYGFNKLISKDIVLLSIEKVSDNFHARFNAKTKTYLYKILNKKVADPFRKNLAYQLSQPLDIDAMKKAAKLFEGEHNFQNFTSKEEDDQNFVRKLHSISINKNDNLIAIELIGNGFMRYMVRMIVGNLVQIGLGKMNEDEILFNLNSEVRKPSSYKAPAEGLYLKEVSYK